MAFDAFDSVWRPEPVDGQPTLSSIKIAAGKKGCWVGGRVLGPPSGETFGEFPEASAGISSVGRRRGKPIDFEVEWIEVADVPNALESIHRLDSITIRNALFREINGNCIALDGEVGTITIKDSFFDGCSYLVDDMYNNFIQDEHAKISIRDSFVRLRAGLDGRILPVVTLSSGPLPRITAVDSVFLLEGPVPLTEALIAGGQADVEECRNNILILSDGAQAIGSLPPCFRIVRERCYIE